MTLRISGLLAPAAFAAACCKRPNARSALPQGRKRAEVGSGRWQWRATAASAVTFAFGLFQPAHAQVTYYYTGNPFVASAAPDVSPQGCSFYIPDPCINGHVTGTVIYNSPGPGDFSFTLTANGVTLESNNYNAPSCYVATSGVCELGAEFFVQNGIPTAWDLELVSSETPVSNFAYITTLDGVGRGVPAGAGSDEALFGQGYLGALNITAVGATDSPGVWTTTPPTCAQILTGAVGSAVLSGQSASTTGEPTTIQVTFAPNYGMTLQQAATACGFDSTVGASGFNWIQQKTDPAPSPFFAINLPGPGQIPGIPTNVVGDSFDPPPHGGYTYQYYDPDPRYVNSYHFGDFSYPFFCNDKYSFLPGNHCAATTNTLSFGDSPVDNCFENADGTPSLSWATNNNGFGTIGPNGQLTTVKLLCGGKTYRLWVRLLFFTPS